MTTTNEDFLAQVQKDKDLHFAEAKRILDTALKFNRGLSPNEDLRYRELSQLIDSANATLSEARERELRQAQADAAMSRIMNQSPVGGGEVWLPSLREYYTMQSEQRAISSGATVFATEGSTRTFYDNLRKRVAVLAAGPTILEVEANTALKVPLATSVISIAGVAEGSALPESDPGLGALLLDPKKFGAITITNSEAFEDNSLQLREVVANMLVADTAVYLGQQLIAGDGTGQNLRGLRNIVGVTAGATTGANGASLTFGHLADTLGAAEAANVDPDKLAWFMHARTWASVRKLVDSSNRPIMSLDPTSEVRPTLWGKPVYIDNALPITETKGSSTDCTSILLADMSQVLVGESRHIELAISEDYKFNTDQIAMRVTARYDIGMAQPNALTITSGVRP